MRFLPEPELSLTIKEVLVAVPAEDAGSEEKEEEATDDRQDKEEVEEEEEEDKEEPIDATTI